MLWQCCFCRVHQDKRGCQEELEMTDNQEEMGYQEELESKDKMVSMVVPDQLVILEIK